MKTFKIKAALAAGLAHKLRTLDAQIVADTCKVDVVKAIRANIGVADKLNEANAHFMAATLETETKKRAVWQPLQDKYNAESASLSTEEKGKIASELTAEYNKLAAEIQKESTAKPDEEVAVSLSDEDYNDVLMPIFKKTVQLWDLSGDGSGQMVFLSVANALESAQDS